MSEKSPTDLNWGVLVVTVGLASAISAAGLFVNEMASERHERRRQECEIAAQLLQDERPSPYLSASGHRAVVEQSARRIIACLKE